MTDNTVALVRQAILTVLDEANPRTAGLAWDFNDDEQRVDFADAVVTWLPQALRSAVTTGREEGAASILHTLLLNGDLIERERQAVMYAIRVINERASAPRVAEYGKPCPDCGEKISYPAHDCVSPQTGVDEKDALRGLAELADHLAIPLGETVTVAGAVEAIKSRFSSCAKPDEATVTYGGFVPLTHEAIQNLRGNLQELVAPDEIKIDDIDALCDMALASLNEPLPGCGHASQFAFTEDGGKHIVCLLCERTNHGGSNPQEATTAILQAQNKSLREYLTTIQDSTYRNAATLRGIAHDGLQANPPMIGEASLSANAKPELPAELFDGYAVWEALGDDSAVSQRTVAAVLDVVVRLIRKNRG